MRILDRTVFIGANVYAHYPVIRLLLQLGPLEEWPSRRLGDRFIDRLLAALPGLATHGCSYSAPGGFVRRLREDEGTWMGHILEHVTLELQHLTGADVGFGKTRSTGQPGEYYLVYEYEDADVGVQAGIVAERFLRSIIPVELHGGGGDAGFDLRNEVARLVALARHNAAAVRLSPAPERVPAVVVMAGDACMSEAAAILADDLGARGRTTLVADCTGAHGERDALRAHCDTVIVATSRRLLLDTGLGMGRCDAAVIAGPLHGDRDPLHLPVEIAERSRSIAAGASPAEIARATAELIA